MIRVLFMSKRINYLIRIIVAIITITDIRVTITTITTIIITNICLGVGDYVRVLRCKGFYFRVIS